MGIGRFNVNSFLLAVVRGLVQSPDRRRRSTLRIKLVELRMFKSHELAERTITMTKHFPNNHPPFFEVQQK